MCPVAAARQSSKSSNLTYMMSDNCIESTTMQLCDAWIENQTSSKSYSYR